MNSGCHCIIVLVAMLVPQGENATQEATIQNVGVANTSSPRDTLKSFIDSCNQIYDFLQEHHYMDRNDASHPSYDSQSTLLYRR